MINRKYIVCTPDQGLEEGMARIVNASNESEALSKYAQHVMIKNELFLEYVYTTLLQKVSGEVCNGNGGGGRCSRQQRLSMRSGYAGCE